jgi:hypothetical protein
MSELVGLAASISILLDLAKEVLEYLKDTYHGSKERNDIYVEVVSTQEILLQVKEKSNQDIMGGYRESARHAAWSSTDIGSRIKEPRERFKAFEESPEDGSKSINLVY